MAGLAARLAGLGLALCLLAAVGRAAVQEWREAGLAAFDTVWRVVDETYFDPDFGGLDWSGLRTEIRPKVEAASSAVEQRTLIRELLAHLGQSHFTLLSRAPEALDLLGPASVPFDVRLAPAGVLVTRLHTARGNTATVRPGDRLLAIDGKPVGDLMAAIDPSHPRLDEIRWRSVMRALSGTPDSRLELTVQSPGGAIRPLTVRRVVESGDEVVVGNLPPLRAQLETAERSTRAGRRVGIIRFNIWMAAVAEPFARAVDRFRDRDGLVIDLRGNPGGLADMIRGVAGHLVDEPVLLGRMHMRGLDLEFRANPRRSTTDGRSVVPYAGPVAVLVDELTASASECFAGGLQALGRARVFGRRTAGQALPASTQQLATGDVFLYAVGDFVTSAGVRLEGTGVVPDEDVPLVPERLAAGQDAEAAALAWMDAVTGLD